MEQMEGLREEGPIMLMVNGLHFYSTYLVFLKSAGAAMAQGLND